MTGSVLVIFPVVLALAYCTFLLWAQWDARFRPFTAHEAAVLAEVETAMAAGMCVSCGSSYLTVGNTSIDIDISDRLKIAIRKLRNQQEADKPQKALEALRAAVDHTLPKEIKEINEAHV